jgi:hypothetical protein
VRAEDHRRPRTMLGRRAFPAGSEVLHSISHGLDDQPGTQVGDVLKISDSSRDPSNKASISPRIFSVGDTRTDTGVVLPSP